METGPRDSTEVARASAPPPGLRADEPSDRDLVALARQGDATAFTTLVNRHEKQIYRLALRMMGNDSDAEEVLQETFLNAFEKLGEFRGDAAFNSWIYRIAANSALMRLRRKRRAPDTVTLGEPAGAGSPDLQAGPKFGEDGAYAEPPRSDWSLRADDALQNAQLGRAIEQSVTNLPEDYRVVFLLKDVDGLSNEQIAESLNLSVPAVKSRLHRARLALREQLTEFFSA
jgi:RNA polymerase sigma-70 factor (ECF subfamily)